MGFCSDARAEDYDVSVIGGWATAADDPTTLSGALHLATDSDVIVFENDLMTPGDWPEDWLLPDSYAIFSHTASDLMFDLGIFTLGGVPLDFRTGGHTFTFTGGTLGTGDGMRIGYEADANVVFNNGTLNAGILNIGSATRNGRFSLIEVASGSSAGAITLTGSGSELSFHHSMLTATGDFTATGGSTLDLAANSTLEINGNIEMDASTLNLDASTLTTAGNFTVTGGSTLDLAANSTLEIDGNIEMDTSTLNLDASTLTTTENFTVTNGSTVILADSSLNVSDLTVSGVNAYEETPGDGDYRYTPSTFSGSGALNHTGNLLFEKGASVDLRDLFSGPLTVTATSGLTVDSIYSHKEGATSYQTQVDLGGQALIIDGGVANVSNGADLAGVTDITVGNSGALNVTGATFDDDSGGKYYSWLHADGNLTVDGGMVSVLDGGKIDGLTNITLGNTTAGTLNISGRDNEVEVNSTVTASGDLIVGNGNPGTLAMSDAGQLIIGGNTFVGSQGTGAVTVHGVGSSNVRTALSSNGTFILGDGADGSLAVTTGALVDVDGIAIIGNTAGTTGTLSVTGRGGTGDEIGRAHV